jgi:hypothetical protein
LTGGQLVRQVLRNLVSAILLVFAVVTLLSFLSSRWQIPPELEPFGSEQFVFQVHAQGDQIYVCHEDGAKFAWVLKAPDAQLFVGSFPGRAGEMFAEGVAKRHSSVVTLPTPPGESASPIPPTISFAPRSDGVRRPCDLALGERTLAIKWERVETCLTLELVPTLRLLP